jgi:large subunit ribosomal protein L13e
MVKHNTMIFDNHLRKDWQTNVKTWFNQPAKKNARMAARKKKLALNYPRPVDTLRPVVRCPTLRYKNRLRLGRGFTLEELREVKLNALAAKQIGISVDHRRANKTIEEKQVNVERLKKYLSKLVLFPRNGKDAKKGVLVDSTKEKIDSLKNIKQEKLSKLFAVPCLEKRSKPMAVTEEMKKGRQYLKTKLERVNKKWAGRRAKIQKAKEEENKMKA